MKQLSVLVVGAGMYVCGRGTEGLGTILPALYQGCREGLVGAITVAATDPRSVKELRKKIKKLNSLFGIEPAIDCFPQGREKDKSAYRKAVNSGNRPDCAIISAPDHLHSEIASYLIKQGIHCLVVKPLAPTAAEVCKLIRLQKSRKVYGAVEFHKRFDRSNMKLRDTIAQGEIGDPLYFIVEYSQRKSVPSKIFRKWLNHTNVFQYLGIHYLDIIYFVTGAKPLRVMALGQKNYLASKGIDNYDAIECVVEWRARRGYKFTSTIITNWIDPEKTSAMSDQKIKVIGTQGRYEADQKDRGITLISEAQGIQTINPDFCQFYGTPGKTDLSFRGYGVDSIMQFLKDVRALKDNRITLRQLEESRPTFRQSLVPSAILEAANRSLAQNGKWVKL